MGDNRTERKKWNEAFQIPLIMNLFSFSPNYVHLKNIHRDLLSPIVINYLKTDSIINVKDIFRMLFKNF